MQNSRKNNTLLWIAYMTLLLITSITTGESLARTFEVAHIWGRLVCYSISFVLLAILYSFGLDQIKKMAKKGQGKALYVYIALFSILWLIASVYTNTHSIYILLNKNEIRRAELSSIQNNLRGLKANTDNVLENIKQDYKSTVEAMIVALENQIKDRENPGIGTVARTHLKNLTDVLGPNNFTVYENDPNYVRVATKITTDLTAVLDKKLEEMDAPIQKARTLFEEQGTYSTLLQDLDEAIYDYNNWKEEDIRQLLRRAYQEYENYSNQLHSIFDNKLLGTQAPATLADIYKELGEVPETVESIRLERIPNLLWYVRKHHTLSTFVWALAFAILLDLVSFWVYYAGILESKKGAF